jgi:hypothetical protein
MQKNHNIARAVMGDNLEIARSLTAIGPTLRSIAYPAANHKSRRARKAPRKIQARADEIAGGKVAANRREN